MEPQKDLLGALHRDFWAYASMILSPGAKRSLENGCRNAGVPAPMRASPPGAVGPALFLRVLRVASAKAGEDFVRHAGYFSGANAARGFEANLKSPNAGAARLAAAFHEACPSLGLEASAPSPGRLEVRLTADRPIEPALAAYARGFLRGAARRLNEGSLPTIRERWRGGARVWSATVLWNARAPAGTSTRAERKRRK